MGDLELSEHILTDNVQWQSSKELVLDPNCLERVSCTSEEDESDTDTTVSIGDVQDIDKNQIQTSIKHLSIKNSSGVVVGNQAYYHGDVTIQQYVLNSKDGIKVLPGYEGAILPLCATEKDESTGLKKIVSSLKWRHLWYAVIILLLILGLSVTLIILFPPQTEGYNSAESENKLIIYNRTDWNAETPNADVTDLKEIPPKNVFIAHTGGRHCHSFSECSLEVKNIQKEHIHTKHWLDIGYNFLVGGDGAIYSGLGWDKHGNHSPGNNHNSIAICFIGDFMKTAPPQRQVVAALKLISRGVSLKKITPDYKLQLQLGKNLPVALMKVIQQWPHYSSSSMGD